VVLVEPINGANPSDVKVANRTKVDFADGQLSVKIGRLTRGQAKLTNGSGNIEVGISEGSAADLDVNSERGSVRNSVPSPEDPATSGNRVTVHARTRHGDVIIRRAAS
jgi:hypothetical protein